MPEKKGIIDTIAPRGPSKGRQSSLIHVFMIVRGSNYCM